MSGTIGQPVDPLLPPEDRWLERRRAIEAMPHAMLVRALLITEIEVTRLTQDLEAATKALRAQAGGMAGWGEAGGETKGATAA